MELVHSAPPALASSDNKHFLRCLFFCAAVWLSLPCELRTYVHVKYRNAHDRVSFSAALTKNGVYPNVK